VPEIRAVPPAPTVTASGETLSGTFDTGAVVVVLVVVVVVELIEVVVESGVVVSGVVVSGVVESGVVAAAATESPVSWWAAGDGATPPIINKPHPAVAAATTAVATPPTRITTKS
jgi:hypothetical protein